MPILTPKMYKEMIFVGILLITVYQCILLLSTPIIYSTIDMVKTMTFTDKIYFRVL